MISLQYVAGMFDGEGSIFSRSWKDGKSYTLSCQITNTDYRVIKAIQKDYGGLIQGERHIIRNHKHKNNLVWNAGDCQDFISKILPYLIIKKEQVELALTFPIHSRGSIRTQELIERQKFIYEELKRLKTIRYECPQEFQHKAEVEHKEMLRKQKLAKELSIQGFTCRQIGEKIGVSGAMVSKYLNN